MAATGNEIIVVPNRDSEIPELGKPDSGALNNATETGALKPKPEIKVEPSKESIWKGDGSIPAPDLNSLLKPDFVREPALRDAVAKTLENKDPIKKQEILEKLLNGDPKVVNQAIQEVAGNVAAGKAEASELATFLQNSAEDPTTES